MMQQVFNAAFITLGVIFLLAVFSIFVTIAGNAIGSLFEAIGRWFRD